MSSADSEANSLHPAECERLQAFAVEIWQLMQLLDKKTKENDNLSKSVLTLKKQLSTCVSEKQEIYNDLTKKSYAYIELEAKNLELKESLHIRDEKLQPMKTRLQSLSTKAISNESEIRALKEQNKLLTETMNKMKEELEDHKENAKKKVKSKVIELEQNNKHLMSLNQSLKESLAISEQQRSVLSKSYDDCLRNVQNIENEFKALNDSFMDLATENVNLHEAVHRYKKQCEQITQANEKGEAVIQELLLKNTKLETIMIDEGIDIPYP